MARSQPDTAKNQADTARSGTDAKTAPADQPTKIGRAKKSAVKSEIEIAKTRERQKKRLIAAELKKLEHLFEPLGEKEREFLQPLLENAAFMRVTLDELQQEINQSGAVDSYQNGAAQHGVKISANIQAYNQLMKTYHALMDKLLARLPADERKGDALDQFRL